LTDEEEEEEEEEELEAEPEFVEGDDDDEDIEGLFDEDFVGDHFLDDDDEEPNEQDAAEPQDSEVLAKGRPPKRGPDKRKADKPSVKYGQLQISPPHTIRALQSTKRPKVTIEYEEELEQEPRGKATW
jgi:hypothetical protein